MSEPALQQMQRKPARPAWTATPARGGLLQRKCACGGTPGPTGECAECRKKRLQRKAQNSELASRDSSSVPFIVHEVLRSPGQPLDSATRAFMEPRFDHDFTSIQPQAGLDGEPGNQYEEEADRMAERAVHGSTNEPHSGYDFSHVIVHTGAQAAESARSVNALAYTVGPHIVFGTGQYAPGTTVG